MVYSGPHFYVANPLYKTPKAVCTLNSDYEIIDLSIEKDDSSILTNYTPNLPLPQYRSIIQGFPTGHDALGNVLYDCWMDYYKVAIRRMTGGGSGERTLTGAILPKYTSVIDSITTFVFKDAHLLTEMAALTASLPLDYYIKVIGISNIHASTAIKFPLGIAEIYKSSLFARTLRLNCVTNRYEELWSEVWEESFKSEQWSIEDSRLTPWNNLTPKWSHGTPLRNYFERRQALVEIDVIAAMALGLTLNELVMMYEIQFPVLQQNEDDTWYDQKGNIVFTCSKGLTGVGLDRKAWESMRGSLSEDGMTYTGTSETYEHTIDPAKSELYGGQKVTYYAPYNRCDRIEDYRRAWAHFEKVFKEENKD